MSYYATVAIISLIASRFVFPLLFKVISSMLNGSMGSVSSNNYNSSYSSNNDRGYGRQANNRGYGRQANPGGYGSYNSNYSNQYSDYGPQQGIGVTYERVLVFLNFILLYMFIVINGSTSVVIRLSYGILLLIQLISAIFMSKSAVIYTWIFRLQFPRAFGGFQGRGNMHGIGGNSQFYGNNQYGSGYSNNMYGTNQYGGGLFSRNKGNRFDGNYNNSYGTQDIFNPQLNRVNPIASAIANKITTSSSKSKSDQEVDEDDIEEPSTITYSRDYPGTEKDGIDYPKYDNKLFPVNGCNNVLLSSETSELIFINGNNVSKLVLGKYCAGCFVIQSDNIILTLLKKCKKHMVVPVHIGEDLVIHVSEYGDSLANAHLEKDYFGISSYSDFSIFQRKDDESKYLCVIMAQVATPLYSKRVATIIMESDKNNIKVDNSKDECILFKFSGPIRGGYNKAYNISDNKEDIEILYNITTCSVKLVDDRWVKLYIGVIDSTMYKNTKSSIALSSTKEKLAELIFEQTLKASKAADIIGRTSIKTAMKYGTLELEVNNNTVATGVRRDGVLNSAEIFNYIYSLGNFECTMSKSLQPTIQSVITLNLISEDAKIYVLNKAGDSWVDLQTTKLLTECKQRILKIFKAKESGVINWWLNAGDNIRFVAVAYDLTNMSPGDAMDLVIKMLDIPRLAEGCVDNVISLIETITDLDTTKAKYGVQKNITTQSYFNINRIMFSNSLITELKLVEELKSVEETPKKTISSYIDANLIKGNFGYPMCLNKSRNPGFSYSGRVVGVQMSEDNFNTLADDESCVIIELNQEASPAKLFNMFSSHIDVMTSVFAIACKYGEDQYYVSVGYSTESCSTKEVMQQILRTPLAVTMFTDKSGVRVTERKFSCLITFRSRELQ